MGIKRLVKQFKHMWLYHSHPCISALCVCVSRPVCLGGIYTCLTVRYLHWRLNSLWLKDAGSRLLTRGTCAVAPCVSVCKCARVCMLVWLPVSVYIMYGCMCRVSLITCLWLGVYLHTVAALNSRSSITQVWWDKGECRFAAMTLIRRKLVLYIYVCIYFPVRGLVLLLTALFYADNFMSSQSKYRLNTLTRWLWFCHCVALLTLLLMINFDLIKLETTVVGTADAG